MNTNNKGINGLQELLQKNYDAVNGYKQVMQKTENKPLKKWLSNQAAQRSEFATQIDKKLRAINQAPIEGGSSLAALHRTWIDVKTAVKPNTDEAILQECVRGEKASVSEYEAKIESDNYTGELNTLLVNQLGQIKSTLNVVKSLEDLAE